MTIKFTDKFKFSPAFTIIELLIVIVIVGVLVAITAVSYTGIVKNAEISKGALFNYLKHQFDLSFLIPFFKLNILYYK